MKRLLLGSVVLVTAFIVGCSGLGIIKSNGGGVGAAAEAKKFDAAKYAANKTDVTKDYTDVSKSGVLTESKKVIVPDFKVYFHTQARGSAETGHALSGLGGGRQEAKVSQKVNLSVDQSVFQQITDSMYKEFIADLKAQGYEVIEPKQLAELFPEYKTYTSGDKMKASPHKIDDAVVAYAPTGMKVEMPGVDIGAATGGFSAFGTTMNDVAIRASDKLEAIRMQPVYDIGFAEISSEGNVNSAELSAKQSIRFTPYTQIRMGESWTMGYIKLTKPVASAEPYGKLVEATTSTDKTRGVMSAMGKVLALGGNTATTHDSNTYAVQADAQKYKKAVLAQWKTVNEMLFERMKMEKADN